MQSDAMNAGVNPGGLQSRTEIRVLLCYILSNVNSPIPLDILKEKLHFEGIANYFETAFAISELLENKNIEITSTDNDINYYTVTSVGKDIATALGKNVPLSVRERSIEFAEELIERCVSERENRVKIERTDDKYYVSCSVMEKDMELASVSLLVPDSETAETVKNNFLNNPIEVLANITSVLTGNKI